MRTANEAPDYTRSTAGTARAAHVFRSDCHLAVQPQPYASLTAVELHRAIATGALGAEAAVRAAIERVGEREAVVHAWAVFDADGALAAARAVDRHGARGPLGGVPIGVKDIIATADLVTGYGSPIYAGFRPAADADCVARARASGAIVVGKTVTTAFASGETNETRNPLDLTRTPGGSSSGSAAAVGGGSVSPAPCSPAPPGLPDAIAMREATDQRSSRLPAITPR